MDNNKRKWNHDKLVILRVILRRNKLSAKTSFPLIFVKIKTRVL